MDDAFSDADAFGFSHGSAGVSPSHFWGRPFCREGEPPGEPIPFPDGGAGQISSTPKVQIMPAQGNALGIRLL